MSTTIKDLLIFECGNTITPPLIERICADHKRELSTAQARASAAETALARAEQERDEMMNRAASLALHLPPETLVGDVRRWRDEFKARLATTQEQLRAALERVPSFSLFEHVLRKHALIDPAALDDPEGFDNYRTHGAVHAAYRELSAAARPDAPTSA